MGFRQGRREAADNIRVAEDGDCPRCGGESQNSSMSGYLQCGRCGYEWQDPNASGGGRRGPTAADHLQRDLQMAEKIQSELQQGGELTRLLGIDQQMSDAQAASLSRLENKWMSGMQGQYNAAEEERKPLMFSMDADDNIVDLTIGSLTIVGNDFDGGEEIRLEYPGYGTEFYGYDETNENGWRRGRSTEETARSIAMIINKRSQLVHASHQGNRVLFEPRSKAISAASLVIYVDDPGGQDIIAEKGGVMLDPRQATMLSDYQAAVEMVLEDGIITPSEDQLLWAMRQQIGISEEQHLQILVSLFGENIIKECHNCGAQAQFYREHQAWWCEACQTWN